MRTRAVDAAAEALSRCQPKLISGIAAQETPLQPSISSSATTTQKPNMTTTEFSEWISALRTEQSELASPTSTSSWSETDTESGDSDNESGRFFTTRRQHSCKRKDAMKRTVRTAPISIPQSSRSHMSTQGAWKQNVVDPWSFEDDEINSAETEMDEDDPAFYGNLAYFRSQRANESRLAQMHSVRSRSPSRQSYSTSSNEEEDIFEMEL